MTLVSQTMHKVLGPGQETSWSSFALAGQLLFFPSQAGGDTALHTSADGFRVPLFHLEGVRRAPLSDSRASRGETFLYPGDTSLEG